MLSRAVVLVRPSAPGGPAALGGSMLQAGPPQLLPIANRPLLLHALDAIRTAGLSEAAIVVERGIASAVRQVLEESHGDLGLNVELVEAEPGAGVGDSLAGVRDFLGSEPFLLHLADSLQKGGLGALVESPLGAADARILTTAPAEHRRSHLVDAASLHPRVEPLRFNGAKATPADHAGVYVLGHEALAQTGALETAELLDALGALGGHVETLRARRSWRLGHGLQGWLEGNRLALEGLESDETPDGLFDTDIQGSVVIHPSAEIRSSVVRGPAVIGPMARLTDAYVGPYSSIGAGVLIEAAEIENSIILPGASIRYLGGRLESSVIGARARVFRDFRLPKAMRLSVGEGAEVALT